MRGQGEGGRDFSICWGDCSSLLFQPLCLLPLAHTHIWRGLVQSPLHIIRGGQSCSEVPALGLFQHIPALPGWQWPGWVANTSQNMQVFCLIRRQGLREGESHLPTIKHGHKLWSNIQVPWKKLRTTFSILTAPSFFQKHITLYNSHVFPESPNAAQTCHFLHEHARGSGGGRRDYAFKHFNLQIFNLKPSLEPSTLLLFC